MKLGIRHRIILVAVAPAVLVALLVTAVLVFGQWQNALDAQYRRIGALARQVSAIAEYNLFAGNTSGLYRQLELALTEPDIVAAAILDNNNMVIASTVAMTNLPEPGAIHTDFTPPHFDFEASAKWHSQLIRTTQIGEYDLFSLPETTQPLIGKLLLKVSTTSLRERLLKDALQAGLLALIILILAVALALGLARRLVLTLSEIRSVVEAIARNRQRRHVHYTGTDELGQLATDINTMADTVTQTQDELVRRINEATASLRAERDTAAQAAESRSRFFAAASHDLRQPAQALGLFISQLERSGRNSPLLPMIQQLARTIRSMQTMLDVLLDYSRLSGGVYRTDKRPVRSLGLVAPLADQFRPVAAEKQLALRVRVADCWLHTDPALLKRILLNLIGNALRYTTQGGVLIACRHRGSHALIEVWDTGSGIPTDQLPHIFEELVQLGNPERDSTKGLGLGLAIVRRTADLLGHALSVYSRVGRGSCFRLTIPLTAAPPLHEELLQSSRHWLLLIGLDPDPLSQITDWGHPVTLVANSHAALAQLSHHGCPALLVIETRGDLAATQASLDQLDSAAGTALPALLIHPGPASATPLARHRTLLSRPFRPARLRALIDHHLMVDQSDEEAATESGPSSANKLSGAD